MLGTIRLTDVPEPTPVRPSYGRGILFGVGAYGLWGLLPAFFLLLAPSGAVEIVGWRILLSLVFCAILLTVTRGWKRLAAILRNRRTTLVMGVAGIFIVINWLVYIYATMSGHVVEAALGYFINPLVTVLLGVFVLHEKLRTAQWVAIGISAVAVILLAVNYGRFPYIALALALSFGLYGLIKKRVGGQVDAVSGLTIETLWLAPVALAMLIGVGATTGLTFGTISAAHTTAMLATGIVTAVPLLLFASAARRLPLSYLGLTQYLTPVLQFLLGVFLFNEDMPPARWAGFALIWLALIVLTVDMLLAGRGPRRTALRAA